MNSAASRLEVSRSQSLGDLTSYAELVRAFVSLDYACKTFDEFSPNRRDLILRHDVDIDLDAAVAMAHVEQEAGWRSTYFVLLTSEFYNLLSKSGRATLCALCEMGHDVGLHFDPTAYDVVLDNESLIRKECDILEGLVGRAVRVIAPHRPGSACRQWLGASFSPAGRVHPYQPRFFLEAAYASDSRGYWAFGHPLDCPKLGEGRGLQLLTHPHLWLNDSTSDRDARIRDAMDRRIAEMSAHAEATFSGFLRTDKPLTEDPRFSPDLCRVRNL